MPEKQKNHSWKNPKTVIAAVSVTMLVTIWNTFATHDRGKVGDTDSLAPTPSASAVPEATADNTCPTPTHMVKQRGAKCMTVTSTRSS